MLGATYQKLVNKIFKPQIGHNMKVYMDDLLIKPGRSDDHITDLQEAFMEV